jgi:glutathione S-transferase
MDGMKAWMSDVVLHQWEMSPFCNKVRRCLAHKGIAYRVVDYNGLRARQAGSLSAVGKLPVLDFDGERIQDSTRIAEFLDRRSPERSLFPEDPVALARVRFWDDWAAQSLYFYEIYFRMLDPVALERALDSICKDRPGWERALMKIVLQRRYPKKLKQQGLGALPKAEVEQRFFALLDGLDTLLSEQPWLVGEQLSLADISVAAQLDEMLRTSVLNPQILEREHVSAWIARV